MQRGARPLQGVLLPSAPTHTSPSVPSRQQLIDTHLVRLRILAPSRGEVPRILMKERDLAHEDELEQRGREGRLHVEGRHDVRDVC